MTTLRLKDVSRTQFQRAQRLRRREQRTRHGQMLVEGPQSVRELLTHAPQLARDFYLTARAMTRHEDIIALAVANSVWSHLIDDDDMRDLSGDGQGLLIVADIPANPEPGGLLRGARLAIATLDVSDPGNLGTIVRSADACGASAILLSKGSAELYSPKVVRSGAGSHFHLPCAHGLDPADIVSSARSAGMQVLAADGAGEWDLRVLVEAAIEARLLGVRPEGPDLRGPVLWVVGNEAHGFAKHEIDVDARVAIPIFGKAESFNVSTAAAVCAYLTALAQAGHGST